MATWVVSGVLLLVMLTGVSYSYPIKHAQATASDPTSTYGGYYGYPYYGGYSGQPAFPDSTYGGGQAASDGSTYYLPSAPSGSAAIAPQKFVAPAPQQSGSTDGLQPAGSAQPSPLSSQAIPWEVKPPTPFSVEERSRVSLSAPASEQSAPSYLSPPLPSYQAGELFKSSEIEEMGDYHSETEEEGFLPPPPGVLSPSAQELPSNLSPPRPAPLPRPAPRYFFPPYDYMFLYGEYPQGTVTFTDHSYEAGMDQVQDSHYVRDYYPSPTPQQDQFISVVPQYTQQASQPMQQSLGHSGAVMEQNQPYGTFGGYQSYPGSGYYSE